MYRLFMPTTRYIESEDRKTKNQIKFFYENFFQDCQGLKNLWRDKSHDIIEGEGEEIIRRKKDFKVKIVCRFKPKSKKPILSDTLVEEENNASVILPLHQRIAGEK